MDIAWQRYAELAAGLAQGTHNRAEDVVRALVRRGEAEASRGEKAIEDLLARVGQNRSAISSLVNSELEKAAHRLGLARQSDIDRLQATIARLEARIRAGENTPGENTPSENEES